MQLTLDNQYNRGQTTPYQLERVDPRDPTMNKSNSKADSQKLAGMVETARLRVETAESRWQTAKEQARAAKRRRKEVRLIARRARKAAKQARANLAEAREALAKAEAKLARSGSRTVTAKPRKRPVKKTAAAPQKKAARSTVRPASKFVKPESPTPNPTKPGSREARMDDPLRQWKLSPMDLPSRSKWFEYSRARDVMLKATDTKHAPWYILRSDDKKRARLNCLAHILSLIPYKKVPRDKMKLPKRSMKWAYDDQATLKGRKFVPEKY